MRSKLLVLFVGRRERREGGSSGIRSEGNGEIKIRNATYAYSCSIAPAQTPLPNIAGGNRAPSSFVQSTTAIGAYVVKLLSCRVLSTSRAECTPTIPSYFPPAGCVSRCDPIPIGASELLSPGRVAKMLPMESIWGCCQLGGSAARKKVRRADLYGAPVFQDFAHEPLSDFLVIVVQGETICAASFCQHPSSQKWIGGK